MICIAAETAEIFGGVDQKSFAVDCEVLAGRCYSWQYSSAEEVVAAIGPVHPFPVIFGIVEGLAVDFVDGVVLGDCLVEGNGVGVVVDGRVDR